MDKFNRELKRVYNGWIYTNWLLIVLYPLALIHMIVFWCLNIKREHARGRNWDILASHFFGITGAFFVFYLDETDSDIREGYIFLMVVWIVLAGIFTICGNAVRKNKAKLLMAYATLVMEDENVQTVQDLANRVNRKPERVLPVLEFLIQIGMPAEVQLGTGQILLTGNVWVLEPDDSETEEEEEEEEVEVEVDGEEEYEDEEYEDEEYEEDEEDVEEEPVLVNAECPNCGAKTEMYSDETVNCEFCGTLIEAS